MKILINFSDKNYEISQKINTLTGSKLGEFDRVISYRPCDISKNFLQKNYTILSEDRGAGYWLWKPYFIHKALSEAEFGDYIFYADAGSYFVNSIDHVIKVSKELNLEVMVFESPYLEKMYSKRDVLIMLNCDSPHYFNTLQREGGFSLWYKSNETMDFVEQYLEYAQNAQLITDLPSKLANEYSEFVDHRHDQSILSLLTKKKGIPSLRLIDQRGGWYFEDYPNSSYPQIITLTKRKNDEFPNDFPLGSLHKMNKAKLTETLSSLPLSRFEKAIKLQRADSLFSDSNFEAAARHYTDIFESRPDLFPVIKKLARCYESMNDQNAVFLLKKMINQLPSKKRIYQLCIAQLLFEQKNYKEAVNAFKALLTDNLDQPAWLYISLGRALKELNR